MPVTSGPNLPAAAVTAGTAAASAGTTGEAGTAAAAGGEDECCCRKQREQSFSSGWSVAHRPMGCRGKGNPLLAALDETSSSSYWRTTSDSF